MSVKESWTSRGWGTFYLSDEKSKKPMQHNFNPFLLVSDACMHMLCIFCDQVFIGSCSQANYLLRNSAMDDSIGGSQGVTGLRVQ